MKKRIFMLMICVCALSMSACSVSKSADELNRWDCTVTCAKEAVTYSNQKIIPTTTTLTFRNGNDFDIMVHLSTNGQDEMTFKVKAGGVFVQYQLIKGAEYMVGCQADALEGMEIKLMVYDGEDTGPYID